MIDRYQAGDFYLCQLVPDISERRIKVGWTENLEGRMRAHRATSPTIRLIKTWPCCGEVEFEAIKQIRAARYPFVGNEVFDCDDLPELLGLLDRYFEDGLRWDLPEQFAFTLNEASKITGFSVEQLRWRVGPTKTNPGGKASPFRRVSDPRSGAVLLLAEDLIAFLGEIGTVTVGGDILKLPKDRGKLPSGRAARKEPNEA